MSIFYFFLLCVLELTKRLINETIHRSMRRWTSKDTLIRILYPEVRKVSSEYFTGALSIVTTRPFSERNNLVNKRCRNWANNFSIIRCRVINLVTDSDEKMAALCVCCGESKSKFYSFTSKKCALYEIGNQAIHNRNCTRSNFRRTI